jgi:hypothetical protein
VMTATSPCRSRAAAGPLSLVEVTRPWSTAERSLVKTPQHSVLLGRTGAAERRTLDRLLVG